MYYTLPSKPIRDLIGIVDSDGYLYYNKDKEVVAQYSIAGERWGTYQYYLLLNRDVLIEKLTKTDKALVWIMREHRRELGNVREKFGDFYVEKNNYFIGYLDEKDFKSIRVLSDNSESKCNG